MHEFDEDEERKLEEIRAGLLKLLEALEKLDAEDDDFDLYCA